MSSWTSRPASPWPAPATPTPGWWPAIKDQADRLIHIAATDFYEPRYVEFTERLAAIAPFAEKARVFLTNSGTEAVEGAIKLARYHTHRPGIIAFEGAFHGRTMGALSLTNSKLKQRAGFGPLLPMVHHAPFPRVRGLARGVRRGRQRRAGGAATQHPGPPDRAVRRGRHRGGAGPGRGRLLPGPRCLPAGPARDLRRARHPAGRRRDPVGHGPHRQLVGDAACRRGAGHRHHRQGHRLGHADRRVHRPGFGLDLAAGRPRLDVRRQPDLGGGRAGDAGAARGRPDRQRGAPWATGCTMRSAAGQPGMSGGARHPRSWA